LRSESDERWKCEYAEDYQEKGKAAVEVNSVIYLWFGGSAEGQKLKQAGGENPEGRPRL
jgi:hypothetical protein